MMRWLVRALLICVAVVILLCGFVGYWFLVYSADLPDVKALARYAPAQATRVSDPCLPGDSIAIPYDAIGYNLRAALNAVEGHERPRNVTLAYQIARTMFCLPSRQIDRELKEVRLSARLKRHFSPDELLTIYANRVSFGENLVGVEAASQNFFRKEPNQLDIAEAALLAGSIQRPAYLSPYKHPDRALQRRNLVLDAMVADRAISTEQGETAKMAGLGLGAK